MLGRVLEQIGQPRGYRRTHVVRTLSEATTDRRARESRTESTTNFGSVRPGLTRRRSVGTCASDLEARTELGRAKGSAIASAKELATVRRRL